jgi:cell division protein FtsI (penicillin-binding protein 3)
MRHAADVITFPARRRFTLTLLAAVSLALLWRAVALVYVDGEFLQGQGDARHLRVVNVAASRGMILDRNGEPLAASTAVDSVWANPGQLLAERARWPELGRLLGMSAAQIDGALAGRAGREFVYLRRHVDPGLAAQVKALGIAGLGLQREYRRYYPTGEVAGHVVGFTNVDDVGQEGLELAHDPTLRGTPGAKRVIRDGRGRIVEDVESIQPPRPGQDLYLSIDRRLQYLAYRELKAAVKQHRARGGSLVLLDARTGEVLAMVNQPAYNPNNTADRVGARFRNRAVTDVFEPGSTVKPFTVAAGLEAGLLRPETVIDTRPGLLKVGRLTVRDVHNYGVLDVNGVIKKSSNVGATKIALALPAHSLWKMFASVGYGRPTGCGFPGEVDGTLTDPKRWGEVHRATLSYGYGLNVTALQLARSYLVLANAGVLPPVTLLRQGRPVEGERVLAANAARQVRLMLEMVTGEGGTGTQARIAGYRVGGKTGTAKKSAAGGYARNRYLALFAGLAPVSEPRLVLAAMIDEPSGEAYYGGQVAAPVFARVVGEALRILGVSPDDTDAMPQRLALEGETVAASSPPRAGDL